MAGTQGVHPKDRDPVQLALDLLEQKADLADDTFREHIGEIRSQFISLVSAARECRIMDALAEYGDIATMFDRAWLHYIDVTEARINRSGLEDEDMIDVGFDYVEREHHYMVAADRHIREAIELLLMGNCGCRNVVGDKWVRK